jgi:hypothetical protein
LLGGCVWPGVHSVRALLDGEPLAEHWFSRTQEYAARRRGEAFDPLQYATRETLVLYLLPCWKHLPSEQYRERVSSLAKSPAPSVHAASKAARLALYEAYAWFVAAYRTAAEKLRGGDRTVCFPAGSFPPALPFVPG